MFWFLEVPAITRCRKLLADGSEADLREAEKRLRDYLQQNLGQHNHCQAIDIMVLLALAVHRQGRADESLEILEQVVRLAEPGGWVRPFVEAGPPMADLLEGLKKKGIAPDFIERLLSVFQECEATSGERGIQNAPVGPSSHPSMVESLTNRERDILELLSRRWQNKEIASKLNVSPETVKSHLKNIYQKLDAPNRIQAVEKARRLGLLPEK
jgi:LuxR family maltose regulon positive regulatory protein